MTPLFTFGIPLSASSSLPQRQPKKKEEEKTFHIKRHKKSDSSRSVQMVKLPLRAIFIEKLNTETHIKVTSPLGTAAKWLYTHTSRCSFARCLLSIESNSYSKQRREK